MSAHAWAVRVMQAAVEVSRKAQAKERAEATSLIASSCGNWNWQNHHPAEATAEKAEPRAEDQRTVYQESRSC